jgi:hypothetical protein
VKSDKCIIIIHSHWATWPTRSPCITTLDTTHPSVIFYRLHLSWAHLSGSTRNAPCGWQYNVETCRSHHTHLINWIIIDAYVGFHVCINEMHGSKSKIHYCCWTFYFIIAGTDMVWLRFLRTCNYPNNSETVINIQETYRNNKLLITQLNIFFLPSVIPIRRTCKLVWAVVAPVPVTSENFNIRGSSRNIERCAIFSSPCLQC